MERRVISRRGLLRRLGLAAGAAAGAGASADLLAAASSSATPSAGASGPGVDGSAEIPFFGGHQAGIATTRPSNVLLSAFDLTTGSATDLADLLRGWTAMASRLVRGLPASSGDSGETAGLAPFSLTLTFGLGPGVFDQRFGLADRAPKGFAPLPAFPGDQLDQQRSGGDLVVQACADSEMVCFHAVRQLAEWGADVVVPRWQQAGFGAPTSVNQVETSRNLLGFRDGTANPSVGSALFGSTVWAGVEAPSWLRGGTYLCARVIRIDLARWDGTTVAQQEEVIGRRKVSGAPLSGGTEDTELDFTATGGGGRLLIPVDSHVRLASPLFNDNAFLYRRGFAYDNGFDPASGVHDAGQLFVAFVADPSQQFVPILERLSARDRLNAFTTHVASAVFAVPPGVREGGWIGQELLA